jgi:hypothetical protein
MGARWLLLLCLLCCQPVCAQNVSQPRMDRSKGMERALNDSVLTTLRSEREFRYDQQVPEPSGLLGKLIVRVLAWIDRIMQRPGVGTGLRILQWVLPIALILYAILHFMGLEKALPWHRDRRSGLSYDVHPEDVHAVDFGSEIAAAVAAGRYRDATRLQYLFALRHLSEAGRIKWSREKTNRDYVEELRGTKLAGPFQEVTRFYEYAWYGEMPVTISEYEGISRRFTGFRQSVDA